jgi:hypothetical protein
MLRDVMSGAVSLTDPAINHPAFNLGHINVTELHGQAILLFSFQSILIF